jgi:lipoprotein NlpI/transglutaminase-like putative cysteine protease
MATRSESRPLHFAKFIGLCCALMLLCAESTAQVKGQIELPSVKEINPGTEAFSRNAPFPIWALPILDTPSIAATAPIQVLYSESQYLVSDRPEQLQIRAFKINEQSGLKEVGQYPIEFVPAYEKFSLHSVRIVRNGTSIDKTSSVSIRFLQREMGLEGGVYSGVVTATLLTDDLRVGDTFFIAYSRLGANPVFGNRYSQAAGWDSGATTALKRVALLSSPDRPVAWQMHGDTDGKKIIPSLVNHNGLRAQVFEESNLLPLTFETQVPSDFVFGRYLQFTEFKDWTEVAQWGSKLFPKEAALPEELLDQIKLWQELPNSEKKAAAALRWVQDEIRYFSVSIGESSHKPYSPMQVVSRRYGDCKDKTYLLNTILNRLGIEAQPVLVRQSGIKSPRRGMATPLAFDHVVTRIVIDGLPYYLDGTRSGQRGPLSKHGWGLPGADGLILANDTTGLIVISPNQGGRTNELSEVFSIPKLGGDAVLNVTQKFYGLSAESWRNINQQLSAEQRKRALIADYEKRYAGIRIEGEPVLLDDESENTFTLKIEFVIPSLAKLDRGDWFFRFFPNNLIGSVALPVNNKRIAPASISNYSSSLKYSLVVKWPDEVAGLRDPFSQRLSNDYFTAEVQRTFRGNVATANIYFENRVNVVKPKDITTLTEEVRKLERLTGGLMVVQKDQIKTAGILGIGKTTIQQTMNRRLDQIIETTQKVIRDKTLEGNDLAEVHCERAIALADRGRANEGLAEADIAIQLAPNLGNAYFCRLAVNYVMGNFAAVPSDATKALSLGADVVTTTSKRGLARFYLGQFDAAAQDFARASNVAQAKQAENTTFLQLWHAWALLRAGQPLTEELKAQAIKGKTGPWPQPALAMAAGLLKPEEIIAGLNNKSGDDKELALVEAWFYVGQYQLANGDLSNAKVAFESARKSQITMYLEHVAAGFELARLK